MRVRISPASLALLVGAGLATLTLAARGAPARPRVQITAPHGGMTTDRVVTVTGRIDGLTVARATLVVNGIPLSVAVTDGRFEQPQVLAPGLNTIRAFVETDAGVVEDVVALHAQVPAKDLRVTLTWDTPGTDVDLWVTGPDGERVFYGHREGTSGGTLDTDVTTGFGPETYTQARLVQGTFRVQAHAFRIDRPTRLTLTTVRFEGTPEESRRVLRAVLLRTGDVVEVGDVQGGAP